MRKNFLLRTILAVCVTASSLAMPTAVFAAGEGQDPAVVQEETDGTIPANESDTDADEKKDSATVPDAGNTNDSQKGDKGPEENTDSKNSTETDTPVKPETGTDTPEKIVTPLPEQGTESVTSSSVVQPSETEENRTEEVQEEEVTEEEVTEEELTDEGFQSEETVEMFRLYNPNTGEHLYTSSVDERENLIEHDWRYEGTGWFAPKESSEPVYRVYNPNSGDHHYTMSASEKDYLVSIGWNDEGIGWYSDIHHAVPVYRQFNPNETVGTHNYSTSAMERDFLVSVGWLDENIGWYAVKAGYSIPTITKLGRKAQQYSTPTSYLIFLDKSQYRVTVLKKSPDGSFSDAMTTKVSIGKSTPSGTFHMGETNPRLRYFNSGKDCYCWWATNITGRKGENYFFHSVLYKYGEDPARNIIDGRLGQTISHGCVRMPIEKAKWIYDNVPDGTTIVIQNSI